MPIASGLHQRVGLNPAQRQMRRCAPRSPRNRRLAPAFRWWQSLQRTAAVRRSAPSHPDRHLA